MAKKRIAIVGAGPGGYVAAIRAAQLGVQVYLIEKAQVGGTCLNIGCIPTKALLASAEVLSLAKESSKFGIEVDKVKPNLPLIINRKDAIVTKLVKGIEWLLNKNKVELIRGEAIVVSPNKVNVKLNDGGGKTVGCDSVILATGSKPWISDNLNFDGENVITSTEALSLEEIPSHLLIIGAGYIGLEFACIFKELGSEVTIVEMLDRILPTEEKEVSQELKKFLEKRGIKIFLNEKVEKIEQGDSGMDCSLPNGEKISTDKVLVTIGRKLNTDGLEKLGIVKENNYIRVNEKMETSVKGIYAVGDIVYPVRNKFLNGTRPPLLAHKAFREGIVAAENICGNNLSMNYKVIPSCIYTIPEVASVGLSEDRVKESGFKIKTAKFPFSASGRAHTLGKTEGFVKIVADAKTDKVLGVSIIGPSASELIAEASIVIKMNGTVKDIEETIHAHPTLSESLMEVSHLLHNKPLHI